ncbi:MAG: glycosyltransferase family 4 protein [Acidobacteriota bacterium]
MHVVYFVQYFNLPDEPGGSRPYQLARALVDAGHRVTLVTGAVNHKTLTVPERYRRRLFVTEEIDGIRVVRCWSYAGIRGSFRKRLLNFVSFALTASLGGVLRARRPDVVYASSTPLTVGVPGWLTATLRRRPFVFELRDLWPESAVVAGVLDERAPATRLASRLARFLYRRAALLVGVTRGICDGLVAAGVPRERVLFVPNGVDDWMVAAGDPPPPAPRERFVVIYCGAHGRWNGLDQVLDAAAILERRGASVAFEFVGDGDERAALEERARREGLRHVRFHGAVPKREAFDRLRAADASIVVTWDHPFQRMVLANKIFDYLAAGRPVVVGAHGEMADLVREAGAGPVVPPGRPDLLAEAIERLAARPVTERDALGRAGRAYILSHYQRRDLADRLAAALGRVAAGQSAAVSGDPAGDAPTPGKARG